MIQFMPTFLKHLIKSWTVVQGHLLRDETYQMEFGVPSLIGTSAPEVGCSEPQMVGWVLLL